jgi:hypothetical protein
VETIYHLQPLFTDDLEAIEINIKNKLYSWNVKTGNYWVTMTESFESGRRLFTISATIIGEVIIKQERI